METTNAGGDKHLTFRLGREEYGMAILKVREIIGLLDITAVPKAPAYVRGVINLRGKIIPVIDLRRKFGLPDVEATKETCIVTAMIAAPAGDVLVGLLVDAVSEVLNVSSADVEAVPALGDVKVPFVVGLAKSQGKVRILLDIDKVVQEESLDTLLELEKNLQAAAA